MTRLILISVSWVLVLTSASPARTWYVKPDRTGDVPTIQAGVDSVAPGDTVLLASGIYTGTGNYNVVVIEDGFLICSETGNPEDCVIDCEGTPGSDRRGFDFESSWGSQTVLRGITIRNSNVTGAGGAVLSKGTLTIRDCVIESNVSSNGGGAVALIDAGDRFILKGCAFISNDTGGQLGGGAVLVIGSAWLEVKIDSCVFYDNQATGGGAIHFPQHEVEADITNCAFIENLALSEGGAILVQNINSAFVENCTFCGNDAPTGSAIYTWTDYDWGESTTDVRNCIIAYGTGGEGYYQTDWIPNDRSLQCTDIYGNEGGDYTGGLVPRLGVVGNFSACPAFCNIEMVPYDLRLCSGSPCLPGNHPDGYDCGLVGALGEGCTCDPTRSQPAAWGSIKALFR
jgi:hypothetical protein